MSSDFVEPRPLKTYRFDGSGRSGPAATPAHASSWDWSRSGCRPQRPPSKRHSKCAGHVVRPVEEMLISWEHKLPVRLSDPHVVSEFGRSEDHVSMFLHTRSKTIADVQDVVPWRRRQLDSQCLRSLRDLERQCDAIEHHACLGRNGSERKSQADPTVSARELVDRAIRSLASCQARLIPGALDNGRIEWLPIVQPRLECDFADRVAGRETQDLAILRGIGLGGPRFVARTHENPRGGGYCKLIRR